MLLRGFRLVDEYVEMSPKHRSTFSLFRINSINYDYLYYSHFIFTSLPQRLSSVSFVYIVGQGHGFEICEAKSDDAMSGLAQQNLH